MNNTDFLGVDPKDMGPNPWRTTFGESYQMPSVPPTLHTYTIVIPDVGCVVWWKENDGDTKELRRGVVVYSTVLNLKVALSSNINAQSSATSVHEFKLAENGNYYEVGTAEGVKIKLNID